MDEPFFIPVTYVGNEYSFQAQLYTTAYNYRIEVLVNDVPFSFERDDEGSFRAIAINPDEAKLHKIDPALLGAIGDSLQEILS